jgi:acetylornithine deacetylase/succinyl-diaminopimelate desuccinylase-like protein
MPPSLSERVGSQTVAATVPPVSRVLERLDELYAIGGGPGANRPAGSAAEDAAHQLAAGWLREAGLDVDVDADGNLLGRSRVRPDVWVGSHLDSVPGGGRFDGALGVVAAVEAVEQAGAGSVVAFRGEEVGCLGSRALVGRGALPGAFLELHVEQGPVLAARDAPLGIVTSIAGVARGELVMHGTPGHAGTTPMDARDDALVEAAALVLRIRDAARAIPGAVATVGDLRVEPGVANVIPSLVTLTVDARAPDADRHARLIGAIGLDPAYRAEPVACAPELTALLGEEASRLGIPAVELASGAGHDAGILAAAGVPSAMLFVRSLAGGVSHSPDEHSSAEDVELGIEVLTAALARIAFSA